MVSRLGERIRAVQNKCWKKNVTLVVNNYFMQADKMAGDVDQNIESFVCYADHRDEDGVYDALCELAETFTEERLKKEVGIVITFVVQGEATYKWSGV